MSLAGSSPTVYERVDDVLLDVDGLAGPELLLGVLEPLLDAALAHPDDLLLVGVAMERVPAAGLRA